MLAHDRGPDGALSDASPKFRGEFRGTATNDYRLGDSPFSSRMAGLGEELVPVSFSRPRAAMFDIRPNRATRTVDFWQ